MRNLAFLSAFLVGGLLVLTGCGDSTAPTKDKDEPGEPAEQLKDIVDTAAAADGFETLVAAVKAAELVDTLKGEGPFTVFAPTEAAFGKLPAGTLDELLKPENKDKLTAILTFRAIPTFADCFPAPIVEINEEDAESRGVRSGDQVMLKTARGEVVMWALVTDRIKGGVAYAAVGGGGPLGTEEWKQSNVNELTDPQQFDPISGFPVYKVLMCEITRKKRVRRGVALQGAAQGCSG